ncbi:MAG: hypothetical protein H7832_02785 [Magnetococcus sp. DMHC-6]
MNQSFLTEDPPLPRKEDEFIPAFEIGNFITDKLGLTGDKTYIGLMFVAPEAGILALFLITGALAPRINQVLDLNRHHIWVDKQGSFITNRKSVMAILAVAAGVFIGWFLMASVSNPLFFQNDLTPFFAFRVKETSLIQWNFDPQIIISNHLIGFLSALLLAFLYKTYGATLVIVLNVTYWAVTLAQLIQGEFVLTSHLSLPLAYLGAILTFFPHMLFTCIAYVIICLVAIFISKGLVRYHLNEKRFFSIILAILPMSLMAMLFLLIAILLKIYYIPWMLTLL